MNQEPQTQYNIVEPNKTARRLFVRILFGAIVAVVFAAIVGSSITSNLVKANENSLLLAAIIYAVLFIIASILAYFIGVRFTFNQNDRIESRFSLRRIIKTCTIYYAILSLAMFAFEAYSPIQKITSFKGGRAQCLSEKTVQYHDFCDSETLIKLYEDENGQRIASVIVSAVSSAAGIVIFALMLNVFLRKYVLPEDHDVEGAKDHATIPEPTYVKKPKELPPMLTEEPVPSQPVLSSAEPPTIGQARSSSVQPNSVNEQGATESDTLLP
jgi:hypothetical protein